MPSANGAEIKTARDMGIRKLILGDYQLPVLEKAQRRRGKKGTVAIAGDLSVIGAEIARRGIALDFANLDICGYLGDKTINSVVPFVAAVDWRRGARICVNFRTARENKLTSQQFRKFADMTPRQWDRTDKVQRRDIKTAYIASLFETAVGAPLNVIYVETYVPRTKRKPHASIMQTVIVEIAA